MKIYDDYIKELQSIEEAKKALLERRKNAISNMLDTINLQDDEEKYNNFKYLYFYTDISIKDLKQYIDFKDDLSGYFTAIEEKIKCSICGKETIVVIKSRREFKDYKESKENNFTGDKYTTCKNCIENISENFSNEMKAKIKTEKEEMNKLKKMPYKEYLQTEHWKNKRKSTLKKAKYKCELCNSKDNLNVHHKTYENRGCEMSRDLIVLCEKCHSKFHDKLKDGINNEK